MNIEKVLEDIATEMTANAESLSGLPDLRDQFSRIEQESSHDDFTIIKFPGAGSIASSMPRN